MNLAFDKLPTLTAGWAVAATPLAMLTDENRQSDITTAGEHTAAVAKYITIDLGQVYEVYQIVISSGLAGGYFGTALNAGVITLETYDGANWTERATQTDATAAYVPITLGYDGEGIAVSQVRIKMLSDADVVQKIKPAEIEVFGC